MGEGGERAVELDFKTLMGSCYDACELVTEAPTALDAETCDTSLRWAVEKAADLIHEAHEGREHAANLGLAGVVALLATYVSDARFQAEIEVSMGEGSGSGEDDQWIDR